MTSYALEELGNYLGTLRPPYDGSDPNLLYGCALLSELAYYHVSQLEIDQSTRAKMIPCEGYNKIIRSGRSILIDSLSEAARLEKSFVVATRSVVAIAIIYGDVLFISFRGTQFLYEWGINLRASLTEVGGPYRSGPRRYLPPRRTHRGFTEETIRIAALINREIERRGLKSVSQLVLTGHSLGGAIAAIAETFIFPAEYSQVVAFGAPRYCDGTWTPWGEPWVHPVLVRRRGDAIPSLPPKWLRYTDWITELNTNCEEYVDLPGECWLFGPIWRWLHFLAASSNDHGVERYRGELGEKVGAQHATAPFADLEKVTDPTGSV